MQEQSQQRTTTLAEKMDMVAALALFPSMTIMVFLRKRLGYRFLSPIRYQVMVLLLWALSGFSVVSGNTRSVFVLFLFGLAVLVAASVERYLRWKDIKQGISWHSYSRGIPWLEYVIPLRETVIKRFIDPAAAAIVGIALSFLFPWLGYYLVFSAACLFIFESADYQRMINRSLDILDGLIESELVDEDTQYFSGSNGTPQERSVEQTAGIPTGTDPDLAAAIARRSQKRIPPTPSAPHTAGQPMQAAGYPQGQQGPDSLGY